MSSSARPAAFLVSHRGEKAWRGEADVLVLSSRGEKAWRGEADVLLLMMP
jgi:hypothetical protein